jgi:antitoxin HigA-1
MGRTITNGTKENESRHDAFPSGKLHQNGNPGLAGLSVTKPSEILCLHRATFSDLVHEKAALSPEMALRLEKAFHLKMEMLLQMHAWYDSTEMRKQANKIKIEPYVTA